MTPRVTGSVPTGTTITPEEYVEFCLDRSRGHDFNGLELRVAGTVDLTKIRGGRELFTLRKAVVDGDVFADETCALSVIEDCVIEGGCKVDKSKLSHVRRKFHAKGDFRAQLFVGFPERFYDYLPPYPI